VRYLAVPDPDLIEWCVSFVKKGAEAREGIREDRDHGCRAGLGFDDVKVGRERVRWFPALVSESRSGSSSRYKPEELHQR